MNQNQVDKLLQLEKEGCTITVRNESGSIGKDGEDYVWDTDAEPMFILLKDIDTEDIRVVKDVVGWENE